MPSGLPEVLTPEFTHALGEVLMTLHPVRPDAKSPLGTTLDADGEVVAVLVAVEVAVTVVVVVVTPSRSSVLTVSKAVAVMMGASVEVEVYNTCVSIRGYQFPRKRDTYHRLGRGGAGLRDGNRLRGNVDAAAGRGDSLGSVDEALLDHAGRLRHPVVTLRGLPGNDCDSRWRQRWRLGLDTGWDSRGDGHGFCVRLCGNLGGRRDCCRVDCGSQVDDVGGHVGGDGRPYCLCSVSHLGLVIHDSQFHLFKAYREQTYAAGGSAVTVRIAGSRAEQYADAEAEY